MVTNKLPDKFVDLAARAEIAWRDSSPLGIRGTVSLSYHVAEAVYRELTDSVMEFDRPAALERFRRMPMEHLENMSFESFYMNGALKEFEQNKAVVVSALHRSFEEANRAQKIEDEYQIIKKALGVTCQAGKQSEARLRIALEALKLIQDRSPRCDCMDAPEIARDALRTIESNEPEGEWIKKERSQKS